jgi:hypothetical protein
MDKRIEGKAKESSFPSRFEMNDLQCKIRSLKEKLVLLSKKIPNQSFYECKRGALIG